MAGSKNKDQTNTQSQQQESHTTNPSNSLKETEGSNDQTRRYSISRQEAGRLGGTAPHRCRGFECQKQSAKSNK